MIHALAWLDGLMCFSYVSGLIRTLFLSMVQGPIVPWDAHIVSIVDSCTAPDCVCLCVGSVCLSLGTEC